MVKKHQTMLSGEIEERILSMYALGLSYADISKHIQEIYQISISSATINAITDKIIEKVREWQSRPLERIYPFVWLDAIHYNIKEDGVYVHKAVYTVYFGFTGHLFRKLLDRLILFLFLYNIVKFKSMKIS